MKLPEKLAAFIHPIIKECETQFPRKCGNCGKEFPDFRSFVAGTNPLGSLTRLTEENDPFSLVSWVNCECGSTLTLSCSSEESHKKFAETLKKEAESSGLSEKDLLTALRAAVRTSALTGR